MLPKEASQFGKSPRSHRSQDRMREERRWTDGLGDRPFGLTCRRTSLAEANDDPGGRAQ